MNEYSEEKENLSARKALSPVYTLALGVFGLIIAEFLPSSLLIPLSQSLGISDGVAGQAVTATAIAALFSGLFITTVTKNIDRKKVIMALTALQILSSLVVALSPSFLMLMAGRMLLGIAIGGFWAVATAAVIKMLNGQDINRGLAIIYSFVSAATVIAAPAGSYLGEIIGWRMVFILSMLPGIVALILQFRMLPAMKPDMQVTTAGLVNCFKLPGIKSGLAAVVLVFGSHFAFFTYLRSTLESTFKYNALQVSHMYLLFGIACFISSSFAAKILDRSLKFTLLLVPALMGICSLLFIFCTYKPGVEPVLIACWGLAFGLLPVGWSAWVANVASRQAECAGGLLVASVQLAISIGSAMGGGIFDLYGPTGIFIACLIFFMVAVVLIQVKIQREYNP